MGTQKHFYMENQSAYAVPDEQGCITVHNACQWQQAANEQVARVLGKPRNKVRVVTRRAGGAFGGKAVHNLGVAAAASVAALVRLKPWALCWRGVTVTPCTI